MDYAVEKRLNDLEMLDSVIKRNFGLHTLAKESIPETIERSFQSR
jgi:hypothetical protein